MTVTVPPDPDQPDTVAPVTVAPVRPTKASIFVIAEGLPDAYVANAKEIEVHVTQPDSTVEAVILVPIVEACAWAAEIYAAVTIAYRDHTGDTGALTDYDLAAMPDPGRVVFEHLAERWPPPS